ncbi:hypothetical protein niasHS_002596 [Heterodera schachtii]|uniref:Small ribosomal subunit protein mS39 n=1 Tax=Heterodera schachtii TaxID=97005 RepID=A0ABD2KKE2_HETSC
MESPKLLSINFGPLVRILRFNSALADVKRVPFAIPKPIQRSPTDLLKALAGTVKEDETSVHFGLVDDPIMIPTGFRDKRLYLMSKELGRRTARKIVEEWPTLFMLDRDVPELKAFRPQKPLDPTLVQPNEENLQKMIMDRRVSDAIKLYQRIVDEEVHISQSIKLDFFRLLCYYSEDNFPLTEFEEWHSIRFFYSNKENKETTWKEGGIAENLFSELPKTDESFSTLICALCKFPGEYSVGRARELYSEMTSIGLIPFEEVFNSLLSAQIPFDSSSSFDVTHWLHEMSRLGVRPSVKTFNAALSSLLQFKEKGANSFEYGTEEMAAVTSVRIINGPSTEESYDNEHLWKTASDLVHEMRSLGIEPTLATFSYTLKLAPSKMSLDALFNEILTRLEDKLSRSEPIERVGDDDAIFYRNAISMARILNNELQMDRLVKIYRSEHNKVFFECYDNEQKFYAIFLHFKLAQLPLDAFYVIYKIYVPRLFAANTPLIGEILKTMKERKPMEFCWPLLKRVAEDMISSNLILNVRFAYNVLAQLTDVKPRLFNLPDWENYMELCRKIVDIIEQLDRQKLERELNKNSK